MDDIGPRHGAVTAADPVFALTLGRSVPDPAVIFSSDDPPRLYGACSAQTFRAAGSLNGAHRDAGGFLDQVDRHAMPEFWRRDGGVKSWTYQRRGEQPHPDGDMDGVRVFYHAGHGSMDDAGRFHLPMGAMWNGADSSLLSPDLRIGADRLRYLFWSASQSLRVNDGHAPPRSWGAANRGLRMMFGFDTPCWDSGRYGGQFWRHWRMGKGFSQAWLDGAADVSQDQVAVVCAMAPSLPEAAQRLFGERRFQPMRGGDWWLWRWTHPASLHQRDLLTQIPAAFVQARFVPPDQDRSLSDAVLDTLGQRPAALAGGHYGAVELDLPSMRFRRSARGAIVLELGRSSRGECGKVPLQRRALVGRGWSALRRHGFLRAGHELCFDRILLGMSAGTHLQGDPIPETVDEITVQFRQVIGSVPVIEAGTGHVRAVFRPNGTLLRIEARLRRIAETRPAHAACDTAPDGTQAARDMSMLLAHQSARLMRDLSARGAGPLSFVVLPGLTEIGYGLRSNTARLVVRQGIEIRCVRGFRKRYWVQSDLGD